MILDECKLRKLAKAHCALVNRDSYFQRRARVLQSIWRTDKGYPMGECRPGVPLGSRLPMPWAKETLSNYLTATIRDVVRREVMDPEKSRGKVYSPPRIFDNLLSSQPLCFNLFGELQRDLTLATSVFNDLTDGRISKVVRIEFEYSPGRGDTNYTNDGTAFDVYVEYTSRGKPGFIGIEVKYHEDLADEVPADRDHTHYRAVAAQMGCFHESALTLLCAKPLEQIWRDHLLAGSLLNNSGFREGCFVFTYPTANSKCMDALADYRSCLSSEGTFADWTLERITTAIAAHTRDAWIEEFNERYLRLDKLAGLM